MSEKLTIEEIKQLKEKAENDILPVVDELQKNTGCVISNVSIISEEMFGFRSRGITSVTIALNIP